MSTAAGHSYKAAGVDAIFAALRRIRFRFLALFCHGIPWYAASRARRIIYCESLVDRADAKSQILNALVR